MRSAQVFRIPEHIPAAQQTAYCLSIIQKQRDEIAPLREKVTYCATFHPSLLDTLVEWKNKYQQEKSEKEQWKHKYEKAEKEKERA